MKNKDTKKMKKSFVLLNALMILLLTFFTAPIPTGADDGEFSFAKRIGSTGTDLARRSVTDSLGNLYTVGWFANTVDFDPGAGTSNLTSAGNSDVFVSKLDSNGDFVWAKRFGNANYGEAYSVTLDTNNIYIVGNFRDTVDFDPGAGTTNLTSLGNTDVFVLKLTLNGDFVWVKSFGAANADDVTSVAVDSLGNVYSYGIFRDTVDFDPGAGTSNLASLGTSDLFISKLDASGNFVWAKNFGGTSSDASDYISVDSSGNVYVSGNFRDTVDFDPGAGTSNLTSLGSTDVFISKFDTNGDFVWVKSFGADGIDFVESFVLDVSGNIYMTGSFTGTSDFDPSVETNNLTSLGDKDAFISKLNSSGDFVWAKRFGGTSYDWGHSIAVDSNNNLYVTGLFNLTASFGPEVVADTITSGSIFGNIFVLKINNTGQFVYAKSLSGGSSSAGRSIFLDSSDNVYVSGNFQGTVDFDPGAGTTNLASAGSDDAFILKLVPDTTAPIISEVTPVSSVVVNSSSAEYTFTTNEAGTITYGGSCSSATTSATLGSNTITFNNLTPGSYTDCTISVTDSSGNTSSVLDVSDFAVVVHSGGGGGGSPAPVPTTPITPVVNPPVVPNTPVVENPNPVVVSCRPGDLYSILTGDRCTTYNNPVNPIIDNTNNNTNNNVNNNIQEIVNTPNQVARLCPAFAKSILPETTDSQVRLIQEYLNLALGLDLPLTNYYGPLTTKAIVDFQSVYKDLILTPWNLTEPTGIWHTTTRRTAATLIGCPDPTNGAALIPLTRN